MDVLDYSARSSDFPSGTSKTMPNALRLEAIASRLEGNALRLEAIASRMGGIALRLEAIARMEGNALRIGGHR